MFNILTKKPVSCWLFLCLALFSILTSCGTGNQEQETLNNKNQQVRIISLSPHLAELVASAGALKNLVGVVSYSDFPPQVTKLPHVGDAFKLDYEAIVSLQPDIILTWKGGTPQAVLEKLKSLHLPVVETEIKKLDDIPKVVMQIAQITSSQTIAKKNTTKFIETIKEIKAKKHRKYSAFIEISANPLYTISANHWMSEAASLCGFENIFQQLPQLSAPVTLESVININPQSIINVSETYDTQWQKWKNLTALKSKRIITVSPDYLSRPTFRILQGINKLCQISQLPAQSKKE